MRNTRMRVLYIVIGGLSGLVIGAVLGFGAALVAMQLGPPRYDGTFGLREVLVCLPSGTVLGLLAGLYWGFTR